MNTRASLDGFEVLINRFNKLEEEVKRIGGGRHRGGEGDSEEDGSERNSRRKRPLSNLDEDDEGESQSERS